jgi:hypothetical protein
MSDAAKYLPLSNREREDESSVSNDWSKHLYGCLESLANIIEKMPDEALMAPAGRDQYRVVDVAAHLIWRLGTARAARVRQTFAVALRERSGAAAHAGR